MLIFQMLLTCLKIGKYIFFLPYILIESGGNQCKKLFPVVVYVAIKNFLENCILEKIIFIRRYILNGSFSQCQQMSKLANTFLTH